MAKGPGHCPPAWRLKGGDGTHLHRGTSPWWGLLALEVHRVPQGVLGGAVGGVGSAPRSRLEDY